MRLAIAVAPSPHRPFGGTLGRVGVAMAGGAVRGLGRDPDPVAVGVAADGVAVEAHGLQPNAPVRHWDPALGPDTDDELAKDGIQIPGRQRRG